MESTSEDSELYSEKHKVSERKNLWSSLFDQDLNIHEKAHEPRYQDEKDTNNTDEFINYLNNEFVPEIDLSEDNTNDFRFKKALSKDNWNVFHPKNITADDKNKPFKAQYAERRDLVYKTFLRNIRRYLWDLFVSQNQPFPKLIAKKGCPKFRFVLIEFWKKNFKGWINSKSLEIESNSFTFLEALSSLMTKSYILPKKSWESKKFVRQLRDCLYTFSPTSYKKLCKRNKFCEVIKVLRDSGIINKMIYEHTNVKNAAERYFEAVDSIINFPDTNCLMN